MLYELHWQRRDGREGHSKPLPDYDHTQTLADRMNRRNVAYPVLMFWWVDPVKQCAVIAAQGQCPNPATRELRTKDHDVLLLCESCYQNVLRGAYPKTREHLDLTGVRLPDESVSVGYRPRDRF